MLAVAPIVSLISVTLYSTLDSSHLGIEATHWHRIRQRWLPLVDSIVSRYGIGYTTYELDDQEFVGRVDMPVERVEMLLADKGFERMPLSAWKTLDDGRSEDGSWCIREHPLAERQLHVILFQSNNGMTDLYAHEEYNPFNPRYATKHYNCIGYDPESGKQKIKEILSDHM